MRFVGEIDAAGNQVAPILSCSRTSHRRGRSMRPSLRVKPTMSRVKRAALVMSIDRRLSSPLPAPFGDTLADDLGAVPARRGQNEVAWMFNWPSVRLPVDALKAESKIATLHARIEIDESPARRRRPGRRDRNLRRAAIARLDHAAGNRVVGRNCRKAGTAESWPAVLRISTCKATRRWTWPACSRGR